MRNFILVFCMLATQGLHSQQSMFYRTYGGGVFDSGQGILQAADSGFVVAGATSSYSAQLTDVLLFKTDTAGIQEWIRLIGGEGIDFAKSLTHNPGGNGYTVAGYTNSFGAGGYDFYLINTNAAGDTNWTRTYGGTEWDMAYSIDTTYDGGYLVAGETYSYGAGNTDAWLVKVDASGDTLWTRTFGGAQDDNARWVYEDRDSNIIVVGATESFGNGGSDVYIIYLTADGDTIWTRTFGTAGNEWGLSGDMYIDLSNNLSILAAGAIEHADEDFITFYNCRVALTGTIVNIQLGSAATMIEREMTRFRTEGNGVFYGAMQRKYTFESDWNTEFQRTFYGGGLDYVSEVIGIPGCNDYNKDVLKTFDGGYVLVGETENFGPGIKACYIAKIDSIGNEDQNIIVGIDEPLPGASFRIYPNPAGDMVYLSNNDLTGSMPGRYRISDLSGKIIASGKLAEGQTGIPLTTLQAGMYILHLEGKGFTAAGKLIKN